MLLYYAHNGQAVNHPQHTMQFTAATHCPWSYLVCMNTIDIGRFSDLTYNEEMSWFWQCAKFKLSNKHDR